MGWLLASSNGLNLDVLDSSCEVLPICSSYGLNCVPLSPKYVCSSPNIQHLRMWGYLENRVFTEVTKSKWGH